MVLIGLILIAVGMMFIFNGDPSGKSILLGLVIASVGIAFLG